MDRFGSKKTSITTFFRDFRECKAYTITNKNKIFFFIFFLKKMDRFGPHHKKAYALKYSFFLKRLTDIPLKRSFFYRLARLCSQHSFFSKCLTEHAAKTLVFFESVKINKKIKHLN